ncbi:hypothetical protein AB0C96_40145 [Streptomyces sp. NPDC048506]|uniref:hypothetical protein n=1 Tax=Streptomyces sp. NPDC048506 TaxID=3155028 RepID=UPI00344882FB
MSSHSWPRSRSNGVGDRWKEIIAVPMPMPALTKTWFFPPAASPSWSAALTERVAK